MELIDFTIERRRHRRLVGREDVLAQLDDWLLGPGEAGWVVVTGGPRMDKSAGPVGVAGAVRGRGRRGAASLCPRQVVDWDQPERIAATLAAMFPELRDPVARPEGRLIELLGRYRSGSARRGT